MVKKNIGTVFILIFLSACLESDLQRSIFFEDPEFPGLPKYSEWGYNTFGAYFDGQPFISNNAETPITVVDQNENTSFRFSGQRGLSNFGTGESFSISFTLAEMHPETYEDLVVLHNSSWNLANENVEVIVIEGHSRDTLDVLNGSLTFRRAQYLIVDQKAEEVILSGVFEFQAVRQGVLVTVSNGRFDVGVDDDNFSGY